MKRLGLILITALFSASVLADEVREDAEPNITIAATHPGASLQWDLPEQAQNEREPRALQDLEYRARAMNKKIEAQLEERLEQQLQRQLRNNF